MDFFARCACFKCSLVTDKGTYNTYDKERKQQLELVKANSAQDHTLEGEQQPGHQLGRVQEDTAGGTRQHHHEASDIVDATIEGRPPSATNEAQLSRDIGINEQKLVARVNSSSKTKKMNEQSSSILSSFDLNGIAELINQNKINKSSVVVLVGAGMSTAAGVPDFRSPSTGIYANLQKYNLPRPEDVFKIDYFRNNPAPFYDLSRSILPDKLYPTLSHYFIRLLNEKAYLLRCYSQNVDCLESLSGLPKDKLCLAHGSFETGHCLRCNADYTLAWMRKIVEEGGIPHCTKTQDCKGLVKPDIKFFGERLDGRFFRLVKEDFPKCELLIIIGSSLTVMPFAQLVHKVPQKCPRLLINKTKSGHDIPLILRLFNPSDGLMYDKKGNTRDVAFIGACDDACLQLSTLLGWNGELIEIAKLRREELEREQTSDQVEN